MMASGRRHSEPITPPSETGEDAAVPREIAVMLESLRKSGIPCEVRIDNAIGLRLGSGDSGPMARAVFAAADAKPAARWLHRTAVRMFPASRYAWRHSSRFTLVAVLARLWRPF